jgi:hypothetical protein
MVLRDPDAQDDTTKHFPNTASMAGTTSKTKMKRNKRKARVEEDNDLYREMIITKIILDEYDPCGKNVAVKLR